MNVYDLVTCYCPSCSCQVETNVTDARAGVVCSQCGTGFVPEQMTPIYEHKPAATVTSRVRATAFSLTAIGHGCFVAATIALIGVIIHAMSYQNDLSSEFNGISPIGVMILTGFLVAGFFLHLLAQLYHIRAALEEK